ncbi:MAG TPA: RraA family protein [Spirillospora sp.]|nr:RraA family protein [Spirillospora sp.]
MTAITPDVLAKLRTFDTPTICNVIELFEVRPRNAGFMDKTIRAAFPEMPPMVGFAATVTCRTAFDAQMGKAYAIDEQVARFGELSGPPVMVFQDLDNPPLAATFGEIMCTTYKTFGAVGLITNGPGRDLDQVRALDFPVFTDGAVCSHGYIRMFDYHIPVHVGGLAVFPDDLLHGDVNGVTTIPRDIAAEVADIGDEFVAAEKVILDALQQPGVTVAQLTEARRESRAQIEALTKRVSRNPERR